MSYKQDAAAAAVELVTPGMKLGLGTGSTAEELVRLLAGRTDLRCTCTSARTEARARSLGLSIFPLADLAPLDLAVDGADEIDSELRLIKGRGGALLREKIVEQNAARFVVIADDSKLVSRLGVGPLPVEVTPFASAVFALRYPNAVLRKDFRTDEGHVIYDIPVIIDIDALVAELREFAGVVETGYFPREATEALIAGVGGVRRMTRP